MYEIDDFNFFAKLIGRGKNVNRERQFHILVNQQCHQKLQLIIAQYNKAAKVTIPNIFQNREIFNNIQFQQKSAEQNKNPTTFEAFYSKQSQHR